MSWLLIGKTKVNLLFVAIAIIAVSACSENSTATQSDIEVIGVNDYEFFYNDTEKGGSVFFKTAEFEKCNLSFLKSALKQGNEIKVSLPETGNINISCLTSSDIFSVNESGDSFVKMKVAQLTSKAQINLDFSLVGFNEGDIVTRKNLLIDITEKQLETIMAN